MSHLLLNHLNHDFLDAIYYAYYTIPNLGAEQVFYLDLCSLHCLIQ